MSAPYNDEQAARALVEILGASPWEAVAVAAAFVALKEGKTDEQAARIIFDNSSNSLTKGRVIVTQLKGQGFLACLRARERTGAVEKLPSLLYVISVDYLLTEKLAQLPTVFQGNEAVTWSLLNKYAGSQLKKAEDLFVSRMVQKYWEQLSQMAASNPFHVISSRRAIRILTTKPERTPGIGLKAWGTGASAEVNVHISICAETTDWLAVEDRIKNNGIAEIISAVNRKRQEWVYDPEI